MNHFNIRNNVPLPKANLPNTELPIMKLLPDQFVFVPDGYKEFSGERMRRRIAVEVMLCQKYEKLGKRFLIRLMVDEGKTGVGIWRTK